MYCGGHHYSDSTAVLVMVSQAETIVLLIPSCYYTFPNKDLPSFLWCPLYETCYSTLQTTRSAQQTRTPINVRISTWPLRFVVRSMHPPCFQQKCVILACCSPNNTIIDIASEAVRKEDVSGHDFANVMR